jgi:transcriptional regulator with XRE-family HTH domain
MASDVFMGADYGTTHMGLSIGFRYASGNLRCMKTMGVGKRVQDRRKAKGLTQVQLAAAAGVDQSIGSDVESKGSLCRVDRFYALAEALDSSPDELLFGERKSAAKAADHLPTDIVKQLRDLTDQLERDGVFDVFRAALRAALERQRVARLQTGTKQKPAPRP